LEIYIAEIEKTKDISLKNEGIFCKFWKFNTEGLLKKFGCPIEF